MSRLHYIAAFGTILVALTLVTPEPALAEETPRPLVIHVKTSMSIDDAQICVVPNVAWAALSEGRPVTVVFDGNAVTSVAKGYGWRGWLGLDSTAMERAGLPGRERRSLAEHFGVPLDTVPHDYGEYLRFIGKQGAKLYYNETMALLYKIDPERIDPVLTPLGLKDLLKVLETPGDYLAY